MLINHPSSPHRPQTVLLPSAITKPSGKWQLLTEYVQLIKEYERHNDVYDCLFLDAHYVMREILQATSIPDAQQAVGADRTPSDDDNERRRELFKQALMLVRDCEARQLMLLAV